MKQVLPYDSTNLTNSGVIAHEDVSGSVLAGSIYAETVQITNHINNIGGIETIELIPAGSYEMPSVRLNSDTQNYVREIANRKYRGGPDEIIGYVTRLLPNRLLAEIKLGPSRYVKVGLDKEHFEFVRYMTTEEHELRFTGRPIIKLGKDLSTFQEFEAETVEIVET